MGWRCADGVLKMAHQKGMKQVLEDRNVDTGNVRDRYEGDPQRI